MRAPGLAGAARTAGTRSWARPDSARSRAARMVGAARTAGAGSSAPNGGEGRAAALLGAAALAGAGPPARVRSRAGRTVGAAVSVSIAAVAWGCELVEVEVARPDEAIVAEVTILLTSGEGAGDGFGMSASALLQRTRRESRVQPVSGATVRVANQDGRAVVLSPEPQGSLCIGVDSLQWGWMQDETGVSCYRSTEAETPFQPGDPLALEVVLPDGGVLTGASQMPAAFSMPELRLEQGVCGMLPETHQRIDWTPSEGAWAYKSEVRITGIEADARDPYRPDSVHLEVLALGREQTGLVFPRAFGLAEYLDANYSRELVLSLRDGLPAGSSAVFSVTAIDRNWFNWTRNSSFTFSGVVRIPSVFGDGSGVFATGIRRRFAVTVEDGVEAPKCGPEAPGAS